VDRSRAAGRNTYGDQRGGNAGGTGIEPNARVIDVPAGGDRQT
jgi:hypothetical protein